MSSPIPDRRGSVDPSRALEPDAATAAAVEAARAWHLPAPEVVQIGGTAVFTAGDAILRVGVASAAVTEAVDLAEVMHAAGVRVARPLRPGSVLPRGGLRVTAWERIDVEPGAAVDWERVGAMVAKVHAVDPATLGRSAPLPFCGDFPWWQFDTLLDEVVVEVDGADRAVLAEVANRHRWWTEAARTAPQVVLHGDVHPGNVLAAPDGPVLIDWDLLCLGPPEWDHAPLATWTERWGGEPGMYEAFAAGYGRRVDPEMLAALAELRLLAATLMRFRRGHTDPAALAEAHRRMRYWHGDPTAPAWEPQP